jgi:hypothetical protein
MMEQGHGTQNAESTSLVDHFSYPYAPDSLVVSSQSVSGASPVSGSPESLPIPEIGNGDLTVNNKKKLRSAVVVGRDVYTNQS